MRTRSGQLSSIAGSGNGNTHETQSLYSNGLAVALSTPLEPTPASLYVNMLEERTLHLYNKELPVVLLLGP